MSRSPSIDAPFDLVIRSARLAEGSDPIDVGIAAGRIAAVGPALGSGRREVQAAGRLCLPGLVNPHTHLDKANLLYRMTPDQFGGSLEENRQLIRSLKRGYTLEEVKGRAKSVALEMLANGITAIQTQSDVDPTAELRGIEALIALREELAGTVDLRVGVFPQEGAVGPEKEALLAAAVELGADLVGGNPYVETSDADQRRHIDNLFALAVRHGKDLEIQIDETNDSRRFLLPYLIDVTLANGYQGRVTATHAISLAAVDETTGRRAIERLAEARINVNVTPSCNLITQFLTPPEVPVRPHNSITRVKDLIDAGVNVAIGTDNIRDIFYPIGNCSLLRELHTLATTVRLTGYADGARLFEMATLGGARVMGLDYGVAPGKPADLIVLNATTYRDALAGPDFVPVVVKAGRVVSRRRIVDEGPLQSLD
ncbi:MAG TPA: amidohydrolase family protein [Dehalococcoidia bacterium]|nr:amidohydrolase family protein [Dehalococcoidia bacterium]